MSGINFINCIGSAIVVQGLTSAFSSAPVTFQGCTFHGNNATAGAAVLINLSASGVAGGPSAKVNAAVFNGCSFSGNNAITTDGTNSIGGAVLARVTG